MLEKVRKPGRAKNFLAYLIFGAICLVFVFLSNTPGGGLTAGGPVAIVNKEPILFSDYREAYGRLQNQYRGRFDGLPAAQRQMYMDSLRNEALDQLINSKVIAQAATGLGLYTSDDEVRDFIMDIPAFKEDDRFRRERYDNFLSYRKMTAEKFEKDIRNDVANKHVVKLMEMSLTPSKVAVELNQKLEKYKLNLSYVKFADSQLMAKVKVSDKEVSDFISNTENETALNDYFTNNKNKYEEEEQVKARHILVKFDASKPEDVESSLKKIQEIKKRAETEDFAKLAEELSDDPGSKGKGGDLGYFSRGAMVPEFEKVAFSQEVNKISDPVKSPFGYHLIKVEDKKAAVVKTLEDVKTEVAKELITEEKINKLKSELNEWLKDGKEKSINAWVKENKLSWQETGEFGLNSRFIPKLSGLGEEEIRNLFKSASDKNVWIKEVLEVNGQNHIFKVVSFKESKEGVGIDSLISQQMVRDQIVNDVFKTWLDQKREASLIEKNTQIINQ